MSENEQTQQHQETEAGGQPEPAMGATGIVRGVAGRHVTAAGVVDLRGVPPEQVAKIESIEAAGAVLGDEGNREALGRVQIRAAGGVVIVKPDYRVVMAPNLELSRSMLEAMPAAQKIVLVGIIFIRPEVTPELIAQKFEAVEVVGILMACERALGALFGRAEITGPTISLPDDVGPVVRSIGQSRLDTGYLERLADRTTYLNVGQTIVADDVSEDLLDRKILSYHNVGQTVAPRNLLDLLKARCPTNLGDFAEAGQHDD